MDGLTLRRKKIPGYEGLYDICENGDVISYKKKHPRVLRPGMAGNGYLTVALYKNKKSKTHYIHRLISEAFIPNPHGYRYIHHIDANKTNNSIENLTWCTQSHNTQEAVNTGDFDHAVGSRNGKSTLNEEQVSKIRKLYKRGVYNQPELAEIFNTDSGNISRIINKVTWRHV